MSVLTVLTSLLLLTTSPWLPSSVTSTIIPGESQSSTMTCNSCCQGPGGIPGVPGAAGIPGAPGGFGPHGPAGPKGDIGVPGLSVNGLKGDVGGTGISGSRGDLGLRGAPGKVGPIGIQGPRGEDGLTGAFGNQGLKGEKGESGPGESARVGFAGFTVVKTVTQTATAGIVTFDTMISDVAGDYDTNTHKFTCSVPGYYLFTFSIGVIGSSQPYVKMLHNGNEIIGILYNPSGTSSSHRNMGSTSALILLAVGDQVWLHNYHNAELYAPSSWKWTTFTGVLQHAV